MFSLCQLYIPVSPNLILYYHRSQNPLFCFLIPAVSSQMKIFSWVQNKLSSKKSNSVSAGNQIQQPCKEEFSEWPHGVLSIGTLGNKITQQPDYKANPQQTIRPSVQDHLHGLTPEEAGKLKKELNFMFHEHVGVEVEHTSSTSLEAEERNCSASSEAYSNNKTDHLQNSSGSLVQSRGKDICLDNSKGGAIGKKSLSFLLKKMFVFGSGFSPAPSLRDPILESRMEKMLRTILHKKIYPQSSSPKLSTKKSLESSSHIPKPAAIEGYGKVEKPDDGSKWVKTDSEYIVLEI